MYAYYEIQTGALTYGTLLQWDSVSLWIVHLKMFPLPTCYHNVTWQLTQYVTDRDYTIYKVSLYFGVTW